MFGQLDDGGGEKVLLSVRICLHCQRLKVASGDTVYGEWKGWGKRERCFPPHCTEDKMCNNYDKVCYIIFFMLYLNVVYAMVVVVAQFSSQRTKVFPYLILQYASLSSLEEARGLCLIQNLIIFIFNTYIRGEQEACEPHSSLRPIL